jgi:hypothetical protein
MNARRIGVVIAGLVVAGVISLPSWAAEDDGDEALKVSENMVVAAQKTLEAKLATFDVGRATLEEVYIWSRRTVEASQYSAESVQRHLALMKDLHKRVIAKNRVGAAGGEEEYLHAAEYYLAEAEQLNELWAD